MGDGATTEDGCAYRLDGVRREEDLLSPAQDGG
jgi:hypothetical protein